MPKPLKVAESANSSIQIILFIIIFVFKSNISNIRSIFEKTLSPILLPLAIIPDAVASLFALYHFIRAKNKNLGKTFDLIHTATKTALVFTAVFAGLSLFAVHSLFLAAVGSSVVYHLGLSVYHAYHWLKATKNSPTAIFHKTNTINSIIATSIGSTVIAGIVLTMVFAPYLGAAVLAGSGIAVAAMLVASMAYSVYRNFKNPSVTTQTNESEQNNLNEIPTESSQENYVNSNYYTCYPELTGNKVNDKNFLMEEIKAKETKIKKQIGGSKNNFFSCFWSEERKRNDKLNILQSLKTAIETDKAPDIKLSNSAAKSFFKEEGGVQSLARLTENYFQTPAPDNL